MIAEMVSCCFKVEQVSFQNSLVVHNALAYYTEGASFADATISATALDAGCEGT
jgi:predicted nucleic-acid-binding protein